MRTSGFFLLILVFCFSALAAAAKEFPIKGGAELEFFTPLGDTAFGQTIFSAEYDWRTAPFPIGRFSGYGRLEANDQNDEWMMRHSAAYAPLENASFLALAIEYGAGPRHDFLQGGAQFNAGRIAEVRDRFGNAAITYFSNIRGARFSSEWVGRFETHRIPIARSSSIAIEGVYRYRPSKDRAADVASIEFWCGASEWRRHSSRPAFLEIGLGTQKENERWPPFLGARLAW